MTTATPYYLVIRLGDARFEPVDTCIFLLAVSAALLSALRLWQIGQREERELRLGMLRESLSQGPMPAPKRSAPWYHRVGAALAASRIVSAIEQKKLALALSAAGIRGQSRLAGLIAGKICAAVTLAGLCWLLLQLHLAFGGMSVRFLATGAAFIVGWRCPEILLSRLKARRRGRLALGLPDALDLLVVCVEAGLSLDQAIEQAGRDLQRSNREVAEEFAITAAEMRMLSDRGQALENLARRADLDSLRGVIATLNQSVRFGTPLANSLRVLSRDLRAERLARFEERAARLPVLLTIPLMMFILPSLMIVIGAPLVLRIVDALSSIAGRGH